MRFDDPYAAAAKKFRPKKTTVLFVAEAPPEAVERYFYFEPVERDDWLWIALMKALYPSEWSSTKAERRKKQSWLLKFKESQFRLLDAVKVPISGSQTERVGLIHSAADTLIRDIVKIAPMQIVLIKATVYKALFSRLKDAGLAVANGQALPFPCSGQQTKFHNELRRLIDTGELRLDSV